MFNGEKQWGETMGNVYRYGECDHCEKLIDVPHEFTFIVHRFKALTKLQKMEEEKWQ